MYLLGFKIVRPFRYSWSRVLGGNDIWRSLREGDVLDFHKEGGSLFPILEGVLCIRPLPKFDPHNYYMIHLSRNKPNSSTVKFMDYCLVPQGTSFSYLLGDILVWVTQGSTLYRYRGAFGRVNVVTSAGIRVPAKEVPSHLNFIPFSSYGK